MVEQVDALGGSAKRRGIPHVERDDILKTKRAQGRRLVRVRRIPHGYPQIGPAPDQFRREIVSHMAIGPRDQNFPHCMPSPRDRGLV